MITTSLLLLATEGARDQCGIKVTMSQREGVKEGGRSERWEGHFQMQALKQCLL